MTNPTCAQGRELCDAEAYLFVDGATCSRHPNEIKGQIAPGPVQPPFHGLAYIPPHHTDGKLCKGPECKDERAYPWEYGPDEFIRTAPDNERRAPGQVTERRGDDRPPFGNMCPGCRGDVINLGPNIIGKTDYRHVWNRDVPTSPDCQGVPDRRKAKPTEEKPPCPGCKDTRAYPWAYSSGKGCRVCGGEIHVGPGMEMYGYCSRNSSHIWNDRRKPGQVTERREGKEDRRVTGLEWEIGWNRGKWFAQHKEDLRVVTIGASMRRQQHPEDRRKAKPAEEKLRDGWLQLQIEEAAREVAKWPEWKRRAYRYVILSGQETV